ncbi:hypothetical protein ACRDU6_24085 [Mycolicibacterium sp. ELW1]|nr:hypothetical protein [Mycobacterium sp. ELW1]
MSGRRLRNAIATALTEDAPVVGVTVSHPDVPAPGSTGCYRG